jgi:hypothetical protein
MHKAVKKQKSKNRVGAFAPVLASRFKTGKLDGETAPEAELTQLKRGRVTFYIIGKTPLIMNRMSQKVIQGLLLPSGPKTKAEKQGSTKHNPLEEFRASAHLMRDPEAPTLLGMPATAFKGALRDVAVDIPGAAKAQIGRLTYIEDEYVPIYGVPQLVMSVVRNSDMNRTPDVRTRLIVPRWAAVVTILFQIPLLTGKQVRDLFAAAGEIIGVGDFRPQKGRGNYGQFILTTPEAIEPIMADGGREEQEKAMKDPGFYDIDSEELFAWYQEEMERRGRAKKEGEDKK